MKLLVLASSLVLASGLPASWPVSRGLERAPDPMLQPAESDEKEPEVLRLEGPVHLSEEARDTAAGPARTFAFRASGRALAHTPDHRKIAVHTVSLFYFG